ncbi:MAG: J domain-containing protein [Phycisphaerae bacterium]
MANSRHAQDEAFRAFLQRVWLQDVKPLLQDNRSQQRAKAARMGGKAAAAGGLLIDGLFQLRGKPFTRFMTVMGASLGAMLPDAWDWSWVRALSADGREALNDAVSKRAAALKSVDGLALFGLTPNASREELKSAWREASLRWHPDRARTDAERDEHHARFVAYRAAYDRLIEEFDAGRLPEARD